MADRPARDGAPAFIALHTAGLRPTVLSLLLGAAVWELASWWWRMPFLPSLGAVLGAAWRMTLNGEIPANLIASAATLVLGYAMAAVLGVIAGLILGRYRAVAVVCDPYLDALLAVPSLLLVPIFYGLFGLGRTTEVAVVFVYSFVVIAVMARSGLATVDPAYVEMLRTFGASERQVFRWVLFPAALPTIMAGLRLGVGRAVRGLINAEMLVGTVGLGALLRRYGSEFDAARVFGILTVLIILVLTVDRLMQSADHHLARWAR